MNIITPHPYPPSMKVHNNKSFHVSLPWHDMTQDDNHVSLSWNELWKLKLKLKSKKSKNRQNQIGIMSTWLGSFELDRKKNSIETIDQKFWPKNLTKKFDQKIWPKNLTKKFDQKNWPKAKVVWNNQLGKVVRNSIGPKIVENYFNDSSTHKELFGN